MRLFKSHRPKGAAEGPPGAPRTSGRDAAPAQPPAAEARKRPRELGGPEGPEPTRYGDWERKGICYDF